jgi:DNA-binding FrmR family transcriptional regulator
VGLNEGENVPENLLAEDVSTDATGCGCDAHAGTSGDGDETHGYSADKKRYLARLKRIEGQVRGLHRMVDEDTYCIDVLTQVSAVQSALKGVALALLDDHMQHCVLHAAQQGEDEAMEKLDEVSAAVGRLLK